MYYFAYGSNMLRSRLEERTNTVQDLGIATLPGYRIAFNKESSSDGTGKTNIIPSENEIVLGVVFDLTNEQLTILDGNEGGYNKTLIQISFDNTLVEMVTYIAKDTRVNNTLLPTREYRQYLIDGAMEHLFPLAYIQMLESFPTVD